MPKKKPLAVAGPPSKRRGGGSNRFWAHGDEQLTDAQVEFALALDKFKREKDRPYPTCSEVLRVLESLGYKKTEPA
jgi:hypothetical protein